MIATNTNTKEQKKTFFKVLYGTYNGCYNYNMQHVHKKYFLLYYTTTVLCMC